MPHLAAAGVDGVVLVQAADNLDDTAVMLREAGANPLVRGIIGWFPLTDPNQTSDLIGQESRPDLIVGARHLIHVEPDDAWILQPAVLESLALLEGAGLSFDVCAERPALLAQVPILATLFPRLTLVIDHLAKPPIRERGWEPWAGLLRDASRFPNVYAKLSGLNTASDWQSWDSAGWQRYVDHALDCFGPSRLMYGGDWPFALLAADDYTHVWGALMDTLAGLDRSERASLLSGTAINAYRLNHVSGDESVTTP